jgi:predicted nucleic acid-binding protein
VLTYLDANVLIHAARGEEAWAARAMRVIDDPSIRFASSVFLELELLPNSRKQQLQFYKKYFNRVSVWAERYRSITDLARREAVAYGILAIDALHLAAAASVKARLVTFERSSKPLFRSRATEIVSLADE